MQIHLNGNDITNREQLHDALSEALELPEWYGRSLDALYDCPSLCRVYHRAPRISRPSAISRAQNTGLRKSGLLPRMQKHTMPGMMASHDEARYDQ